MTSRAKLDSVAIFLGEHYPTVFVRDYQLHKPLKVDIASDIHLRHRKLDRCALGGALLRYTGRPSYLRALVSGALRLDLDCRPAGVVSVWEEELARERLAAIREVFGEPVTELARPVYRRAYVLSRPLTPVGRFARDPDARGAVA